MEHLRVKINTSVEDNRLRVKVTDDREKLAPPASLSVDGTTLSWKQVANAEKYRVLSKNTVLGYTDGGVEVTNESTNVISQKLYVKILQELQQLATPQNVTADGTIVSWDAVENATTYEVFADDNSIGETTGGGLQENR